MNESYCNRQRVLSVSASNSIDAATPPTPLSAVRLSNDCISLSDPITGHEPQLTTIDVAVAYKSIAVRSVYLLNDGKPSSLEVSCIHSCFILYGFTGIPSGSLSHEGLSSSSHKSPSHNH